MLVCPTTNCSRAVEQGRKSSDAYDFSHGSSHETDETFTQLWFRKSEDLMHPVYEQRLLDI